MCHVMSDRCHMTIHVIVFGLGVFGVLGQNILYINAAEEQRAARTSVQNIQKANQKRIKENQK